MKVTEGLVKVSVRELVTFVLRQGSIRNNVVSSNRAIIGTIAHKKIQQNQALNYEAEVRMIHSCTVGAIDFVVEGRADGVMKDLVSVIIDEIKTTTVPLDAINEDFNPLHWAQAMCYAYFYAVDHQMTQMQVRLTYYHIETKEIKYLQKGYSFKELEAFFRDLIEKYHRWMRFYLDWKKVRNHSLNELVFPFPAYRNGQREVAAHVYRSIKGESKLFVNAPTGIGKTISTLFPALKAMGEGHGDKIFYLTAKTITRTVAEEGLQRLYQQGARLKSVTLTAKDKVCFLEKRQCHPDFCQWANGHYDRVDDAVYEMLSETDVFTRECIETYAKKYRVCPFELALDLTTWADVVIGDYNYVFDPAVALKRFVDASEFILLVDEAHNLVDRAREMYSASLSKRQIREVKQSLGKQYGQVKRELEKITNFFLDLQRGYIEEIGVYISKEAPKELYKLTRRFLSTCDKELLKKGSELPADLLDLYFEVYHFNRIFELFDAHYVCYAESNGRDVVLKQFCIDPSLVVATISQGMKSAIFFSATLQPIDYFRHMLGGKEEAAINVASPFEPSHARRIMALDVSTRYRDRTTSVQKISSYIETLIATKKGHYMVFFPSYKYMEEVYAHFVAKQVACTVYKQDLHMDESDREAFLRHFAVEEESINFCVLGGIFSEGIDLVGEQLIGVMIVGVGIPQIGLERDLIKGYFDDLEKDGYHYAYTYPGMNKVLQAIGRLIRTETDRGSVVLIDDRYGTPLYQQMLPQYYTGVRNKAILKEEVEKFWDNP